MATKFPQGHNGFRLANELDGLLQGIAADGRIVPEEVARIERWLTAAEPFRHLTPFAELATKLDAALTDGVITMDECADLRFVVDKYTTINPYFDAMRAGMHVLMGFLAGVSADRRLMAEELRALQQWTEDWSQMRGLWPFDECAATVTHILATGEIETHAGIIFDLAATFPLAGEIFDHGVSPTIAGVCAVAPDIIFDGREFVFTGASSKCDRAGMEREVVARGGITERNVTKETNYLVVCDEGNCHWAFACYGRKVEKACMMRRDGHRIIIVGEVDFWDALAP